MVRANDPQRILTAQVIGAAWRVSGWDRAEALDEIRSLGTGRALAQACADGAAHWYRRAEAGREWAGRCDAAAGLLLELAVDDGQVVQEAPPERHVTWDPSRRGV